MVRDEGQVLAGLLMGLNAIDYNMTLSAEEFDKSVSVLVCVCEREGAKFALCIAILNLCF